MKPVQMLVAMVLLALLVVAPLGQKTFIVYTLCSWLIFSIAAMGLNLTLGYAGQVSLAQAAFMGIGAYITALMTMAGVPWLIATPLAIVACFGIGLGLGYPALRVQHHFLAFVTLAFNTLVFLVLRNEEWLTGGTFGINNVARPGLMGLSLDANRPYYYFVLGVTVVMALLLLGLLRSPWGKAFTALRDNPIRAESLGVNTRAYTLLAFAIGAAYAGVAGALFASLVQFIEPAPFAVAASIMMYLMVVMGGPGYFFGPVLGAAMGVVVPEWMRDVPGVSEWYLPLFGASVVLLMVWLPDGLLSLPDRIRAKRASREASAARSAAATANGAKA